jgi:hypothetical protein
MAGFEVTIEELVDYFKDHAIWLLEIERDDAPVKVTSFPRHLCQ